MRVSVYLVCVAAALAVTCVRGEAAEGDLQRLVEPVDMAADQETVSYLLPRLAAKYRPAGSDWVGGIPDPRFYLLTEMDSNDVEQNQTEQRTKRQGSRRLGEAGGSLSIVNSLDVLRNRLLLEIARKKAKEGANRNRQFLLNLGKRASFMRSAYHNKV